MSHAARSVLVFGVYLVATGLTLFIAPNVLLGLLNLPPTSEPWIRVLGIAVGAQGAIHVAAARQELVAFFRITTAARWLVLPALVVLVALHWAPPILMLFGLIDTAAAVWTMTALRRAGG